eukprot:364639-Chlamydomonas_euryale.AAC.11
MEMWTLSAPPEINLSFPHAFRYSLWELFYRKGRPGEPLCVKAPSSQIYSRLNVGRSQPPIEWIRQSQPAHISAQRLRLGGVGSGAYESINAQPENSLHLMVGVTSEPFGPLGCGWLTGT